MVRTFREALLMLVALTLVTGVVYPFVVTGIAQVVFSEQANGSLIERDGKVVGSALIGQPFSDPKYFWGRPSATSPMPYNAGASSGSNLGRSIRRSPMRSKARIDALRAADPGNRAPIPVDLVTASASGLDPHISPGGGGVPGRRASRGARAIARTCRAALVAAAHEGASSASWASRA